MTSSPHVVVKRRKPNPDYPGFYLTFIDCPHCGREHIHGNGPGHRVAHCDAPGSSVGYVLVYPSGWETGPVTTKEHPS